MNTLRPTPLHCSDETINAMVDNATNLALAEFKRLGDLASYYYADDSTKEWDLADKAKADALAIFDAHPELHDELRAIGTGFLWLLGMARPRDGGPRMKTEAYRKQLAQQIDGALKAAEQQAAKEGFAIYPFIVGYLMGDCTEQQIAGFDERIRRLSAEASR